jgi:hypothetical protein
MGVSNSGSILAVETRQSFAVSPRRVLRWRLQLGCAESLGMFVVASSGANRSGSEFGSQNRVYPPIETKPAQAEGWRMVGDSLFSIARCVWQRA